MAITWVIRKKQPTDKVGLTFRSIGGKVEILEVKGRADKKTDLVPGLIVVKVNDQKVTRASEASKIVAEAHDEVRIVTNGKHHSSKKVGKEVAGFSIKTSFEDAHRVEINKVNPSGMFPDLSEGHVLFSINGKKITSVPQAIRLMRTRNLLRLVLIDPAYLEGGEPEDPAAEEESPVKAESVFTGVMSA